MKKFKSLTDEKILEISQKYYIDYNLLLELIIEMERTIFQFNEDLPEDLYPMDLDDRTYDWAVASLLYEEYKEEFNKGEIEIFRQAVFIPSDAKKKKIRFSAFWANEIITMKIKALIKSKHLLEKEMAQRIIDENDKMGKRKAGFIQMRNSIISNAADFLKRNKIKSYSPVIRDLLNETKIDSISLEAIRQVVRRT